MRPRSIGDENDEFHLPLRFFSLPLERGRLFCYAYEDVSRDSRVKNRQAIWPEFSNPQFFLS